MNGSSNQDSELDLIIAVLAEKFVYDTSDGFKKAKEEAKQTIRQRREI